MRRERIDILQEFVDLYKHEEMLAFFEFRVCSAGDPARVPVTGLCRVSRPKSGGPGMRYLSLTFVVDTPDDEARAAVDAVLAKIEGDALEAALPAVTGVLPTPPMNQGSENYVRQVDLMLKGYVEPARPFIADRLLPVLLKLTGITASPVIWWDPGAAISETSDRIS